MYFFLTKQINRVFIEELRRYWSYHPKFGQNSPNSILDHIEGKYSMRQRPQVGIVLKNSSGNQVQLAADNFQGHVQSYVFLAHVENYPNLSIEWVREDYVAIQNNGGRFPTAPGIYYLDFCTASGEPTAEEFHVDALIDVIDETLLQVNSTQYQLQSGRFIPDTLKLYRMPGTLELYEGPNYTADPNTGEVTLVDALAPDEFLSADYRFPGETTGPWRVYPNRALREPIPGVVLAFGTRITPGDRLAVVVSRTRDIAALEYGGRWDLSLDIDVIARDVDTQREILDQSAFYLWAIARSRLSSRGIEVTAVNMGGETEEVYDENADDYFYNASFSLQIQTDWSVHVPLGIVLRNLELGGGEPVAQGMAPVTAPYIETLASLTDEQISRIQTNFRAYSGLGLRAPWDPFFVGKMGRQGIYGTGEMLR